MMGWVLFWFALSIILKRNDIVDIAWGLGFIYLSIWVAIYTQHGLLQYLVFGLVFLWGARLAIYLLLRLRGKSEDFRYLNWRKEWGSSFYIRSFFQVYLLQTFLLLIIGLPILVASINAQAQLNFITLVPGLALWLYGYYWQAVGDYQLYQFKKNHSNKGKIIQQGLWNQSRHPNYFGEVCMWWGIWVILMSYSLGWLAILSPIVITWLILRVSGIPMLEAKYKGNPEFEEYKNRVPAFIPKLKL